MDAQTRRGLSSLAQGFAQTHAVDGAMPQVVDENVRLADELVQYLASDSQSCRRGRAIPCPADGHEEGRLAVLVRPGTFVPGRPGRLDLDHSGPQVGEQHGGIRSCDQIPELDDEDAIEWPGPRLRTRSMTVLIPWPTPMHMVANP